MVSFGYGSSMFFLKNDLFILNHVYLQHFCLTSISRPRFNLVSPIENALIVKRRVFSERRTKQGLFLIKNRGLNSHSDVKNTWEITAHLPVMLDNSL